MILVLPCAIQRELEQKFLIRETGFDDEIDA